MTTSSRRTVIGLGMTALAASVMNPDVAVASSPDEAPPNRARWASEFGVRSDGKTDDTAALKAGLQWASSARGVLLLDPGFCAISAIEIPAQATLRAVAGGGSRFGAGGRQIPAVLVPHPSAITDDPLVTLTGTGARLEHVGVMGGTGEDPRSWARRPGVVVRGGIEVMLSDVRVFRFAASGIRIEQLNNARWTNVFVDDCGTDGEPAVRIESETCTNFLQFEGLTIERSANTALDIATGSDPLRDWASNIVFSGLHVESNTDGASPNELNNSPLIDIGNVRAVTFLAPQILGRPAAMVRYCQQISAEPSVPGANGGDVRDQQGGVQIIGGHLKQHGGGDEESRVATIELAGNGRAFAAVAVKFDALFCPAVIIRQGFNQDVAVQGSTFRRANASVGWPASVLDERSPMTQRSVATKLHGWHALSGGSLVLENGSLHVDHGAVRLAGDGLVILAAATNSKTGFEAAPGLSGGWVSPSQGNGTDNAGRVYCRASAAVQGKLCSVLFERPRSDAPIVMVTPRSAGAAKAQVFLDADLDAEGKVVGFTLYSSHAVTEGDGVLFFDYVVVGRGR